MSALTEQARLDPRHALSELLDRLLFESAMTGPDVRAERRIAVHAPLTLGVCVDPAGPSVRGFRPLYQAWATDLSDTGVGMLVEHDLPLHKRLWANLDALMAQPFVMPLQVVYCRRLLSTTHRAGAMFLFPDG